MKKAILVMTYGTPEDYTFEGVAKFFTNIRRGVRPNDDEINLLLKNYLRIEGSPLQEITLKEVNLLKEAVRDEYQVYFANKFSSPYIPDVISKMEEDNIEESRERLKEVVYKHIKNIKNSFFFLELIDKILSSNIIVGNTLTQKNELKFFDLKPNFDNLTFEISEHSLQDIEKAYSKTKSANLENLTDVMSQMRASPSKSIPKKHS